MSANDYTRISYYIDSIGRLWCGPFGPDDNLHYASVEDGCKALVCSRSDLPKYCVEISPWQAAQELERRGELAQRLERRAGAKL